MINFKKKYDNYQNNLQNVENDIKNQIKKENIICQISYQVI